MTDTLSYGVDLPFSLPIYYTMVDDYLPLLNYSENSQEFKNDGHPGDFIDSSSNILLNKKFRSIKINVMTHVHNYIKNVLHKEIPSNAEVYVSDSWLLNCFTENISNRHYHPFSWLSGVLYLTGNNEPDDGQIIFYDPLHVIKSNPFAFKSNNESFTYSCASWSISPQAGKLLLFPSFLEHKVEANKKDCVRRSLSFNIWVRGELSNVSTKRLKC